MKTRRRLAPLVMLVAVLSACQTKDQVGRDTLVSWGKQMHAWELRVYKSICELEKRATPPIADADRLCPTGDTDPGSGPPKPPAFE